MCIPQKNAKQTITSIFRWTDSFDDQIMYVQK